MREVLYGELMQKLPAIIAVQDSRSVFIGLGDTAKNLFFYQNFC